VDGSVLHENAVPVSLSATRRPAQRATAGDRSGVVVRLELPDAPRRAAQRPDPARASATDTLDTGRLARAVADLIGAIDPSLADARVEVQVNRTRPNLQAAEPSLPAAEPDLDLAGRTLSVAGHVVTLTRREFDLLAYLQERRGVALSRRELMNAVWHTSYLVGDRTIDVHVRRLRVKLGPHADRLRTLRGYGYRLD
jgi:DNA-binding response OmpR family regulator